ncbi:MAG: sigma-70 family RNA polymerase sigma factor [Victivallaceae bacterium]|nr:sigma-70 family RNA polymerase sigma factor [Victivallaceae bacterium]
MISITKEQLAYFEKQVILNHKQVLAYALSLNLDRHAAEDLIQDAFLTAFHKLAEIDRDRSFGAYMRGIVRFKYLERGRKLKEICLGDAIIDIVDQQFMEWNSGEHHRMHLFDILEQCNEKLTEDQQQIIRMFYTEKAQCEMIAATMKINETTVRKRLERIRNELKGCIKKQQKGAR